MTISDMHTAFKIGADKIDSLNYANFIPSEIDFLINQAQDRYVKQRYSGTNNKQASFEETQKRSEDLKNVTLARTLSPLVVVSDNKPNGRFYSFPTTVGEEYWFSINEEVDVTYTDCHNASVINRAKVRPVTHDEYNIFVRDPFYQPYEFEIMRLIIEGKAELICATNQTLGNYYLRYIKRPVRVSISTPTNCELSEHTHQEIVDLSIQIALENIEARRSQTFDKIVNTNE